MPAQTPGQLSRRAQKGDSMAAYQLANKLGPDATITHLIRWVLPVGKVSVELFDLCWHAREKVREHAAQDAVRNQMGSLEALGRSLRPPR